MEKNYFQEIIDKYDFINAIYITDNEGVLLVYVISNKNKVFSVGNKEEDEKKMNSLKISLAFIYNSQIEQITRIEKWKTKYITTIYETLTVFQTKTNKNLICHFVCDSNRFNSNILKDICNDIQNRFKIIEKDLENLNSLELNV